MDQTGDIKNLIDANISFVVVGRDFENIEVDAVYNDEVKGGFLATEYLIKKGHKRIALIDGFLYKSPAKSRLEGYKKVSRVNHWTFKVFIRKTICENNMELA
ncbi:MAG TPA: substrate-binding domain-containing protein [Atribacterota bacterium]|nr:substrate-binding domain-containing protein [Atribacterota bacterium]